MTCAQHGSAHRCAECDHRADDCGRTSGNGLKSPSTLASATAGHLAGTGSVGADLELELPIDTAPDSYSATLTLTALS